MVVKFFCEYNGKNFKGFQRQSVGTSVQGVLEDVLSKVFGVPITIVGSGRTDMGVHARGQVCSFRLETEHKILGSLQDKTYKICQQVNSHLDNDVISVRDFSIESDGFNARYDAKSKTYLYRVYVSRTKSPLREEYYHQIYEMPNIEKIRLFVRDNLIGKRDFSEYSARRATSPKDTIRTITRFDIEVLDDEIWFWITGDGFLYKQVRLMVGELLYGKRQVVPAKGLTLWNVEY